MIRSTQQNTMKRASAVTRNYTEVYRREFDCLSEASFEFAGKTMHIIARNEDQRADIVCVAVNI